MSGASSRWEAKKRKHTYIFGELRKDLDRLRQIERLHQRRISHLVREANIVSIPPMSLGTANSLLAQYIRELDVFLEILQAPRGKSRDCWDDALVLLIDHLGHKGRLRRGALERVAQAFAHMGHCVNSESLRTRYELLKQEEWAPVGLRDMWEKQLSGWIESQTSL